MDEKKDVMNMSDLREFDELEAMIGREDQMAKEREKIVLTQNLDGFASSFPDWDLHPPVD